MSTNKFRWIHFSDIHVGSSGQPTLWPSFEHSLHEDLIAVLDLSGPVHLIVFSGDLTQSGDPKEYVEFNSIVKRLHDTVREYQGVAAPVLTVPGNHDLKRPLKFDSKGITLQQYWNNAELRKHIWENENNEYIVYIKGMFRSYNEWVKDAVATGLHLAPHRDGILPGDALYSLDIGEHSIGIFALNSTWLQIAEGNYEGQLHVDIKQFLKISNNDALSIIKKNNANLIITHQPDTWFHGPDFNGEWTNDINPPGRFDAHLFGHMHEQQHTSISYGGGFGLIKQQAASLLGLEYYGNGKAHRTQGYSVCEIDFENSERKITTWPRKLNSVRGGSRILGRNVEITQLNEKTGSFSNKYTLSWKRNSRVPKDNSNEGPKSMQTQAADTKKEEDSTKKSSPLVDKRFDINEIIYLVGEVSEHKRVRRADQFRCIEAFQKSQAIWLEAEWELGENGFIGTAAKNLGIVNKNIFSISIDAYLNREDLVSKILDRYGYSIKSICDALNAAGPAFLLLRVSDGIGHSFYARQIERDLETVVGVITDYAPELRIFICANRSAMLTYLPTIRLRPLDEADTSIYIEDHPLGGDRYCSPDQIDKIYRYTDGVPIHLDSLLRNLEIDSLPNILSTNSDLTGVSSFRDSISPQTEKKLEDLRKSTNEYDKRAYKLLLALSMLPQGEKLDNIKHFLGVHPFMRDHARILIDKDLIYSSTSVTISDDLDVGSPVLIVSRSARDYIHGLMDDDTRIRYDEFALNLYFGREWASGNLKHASVSSRVRSANCSDYEMQNAITLILRHVRRQIEIGSARNKDNAIRLAMTFMRLLNDGDHYRSCAIISEDLIRLLKAHDGYRSKIALIEVQLAASLRLMGRSILARDILISCDQKQMTNLQKQETKIEVALCAISLGEHSEVSAVAKEVIELDSSSTWSIYARMVLAQIMPDKIKQQRELRKLLAIARSRNHKSLTNTLSIILSRSYGRQDERARPLLQAIVSSFDHKNDFYNGIRALIDMHHDSGEGLTVSEADKKRIIEAYHYCHKERLVNIFNKCHKILWRIFRRENDTENMLNLFRTSSFFWRINARVDLEITHIKVLKEHLAALDQEKKFKYPENHSYYLSRVNIV